MIDGSLRQPEQHAGLAAHATEILQQLLLDLLLGLVVDLVNDLHQQIIQAIDDFVLPLKTERCRQAITDVCRVSPQMRGALRLIAASGSAISVISQGCLRSHC